MHGGWHLPGQEWSVLCDFCSDWFSCFFLWLLQRIPVLKVLARDSFCGCSPAEIRRMEKIILDKLNWDLHMATPLDFLHIVSRDYLHSFWCLSV